MTDKISGAPVNQNQKLTTLKVQDSSTGKVEIFEMQNAKITGNKSEYTIRDGKVYDKKGVALDGNIINLLKYQAAAIRAAAAGSEEGDHVLDTKDLTGSKFAYDLEAELQKSKSEYHVANNTQMDPKLKVKEADALEHGVIFANLINGKGEKGKITIDFNK